MRSRRTPRFSLSLASSWQLQEVHFILIINIHGAIIEIYGGLSFACLWKCSNGSISHMQNAIVSKMRRPTLTICDILHFGKCRLSLRNRETNIAAPPNELNFAWHSDKALCLSARLLYTCFRGWLETDALLWDAFDILIMSCILFMDLWGRHITRRYSTSTIFRTRKATSARASSAWNDVCGTWKQICRRFLLYCGYGKRYGRENLAATSLILKIEAKWVWWPD